MISPFFYRSASTITMVVLVRIFHGTGIAAFTTSSVSMVADLSPTHRRGEAFGAFGLATMIALTGAPAGGTWLLTHFSFSAVFVTEAVLAGISLLLSFAVRETFHKPTIQNKSTKGIFLPSILIFMCTITYGSIIAFLPFFAENISDFGLYYTAYAVSSIGTRIPLGKVSDRVGRHTIILPGLITTAAALFLLSRSFTLPLLLGSGVLYGIGFSSVYPTLTALLVDRIPEKERAHGIAVFTASFDLGIAAGSFGFGVIPLPLIYPSGSVIILLGALLFYLAERSSFSSS